MPKIGMLEIRKEQLIQATLVCVEKYGVADTTIIQIAQQAGLSSGIISHYFGGKMGLLYETMRDLMRELQISISQKNKADPQLTPHRAIEIIIECNFDPNTDSARMKVWLSFWSMSMHQDDLNRLQKINDSRLHSNLLFHFKQLLPEKQAKNAARGLAALIDGLWLHGSLRSEEFDHYQARFIAKQFLNKLLEEQ
ncbi:transcriptional regulator BetI [Phocoenobacter skyensis]|uniref:HTH-type transcriptional regulator BetI n=1 Tax=Phocoenobacter skyensis TaxID=97481 RepID=A0A1H7VZB5_9PAST|nr:transcriptional regulator BetI [Pasteurella skyensis]MDP8079076.1 transcriptional regulator BetI [Pasteurella skyensis]MDP8085026.1 transcriptional regulator BetI [Pasteurella skyensis]MDP8184947.1 transcriptional regulator BetI [Pasteurella skyensis]QLB21779.1 transcriptional regulator BetI [Pasteurella skyensis]SEM14586.1 TetR/AcrR family transcriptional regulator, transcriptional repressor of bet genes [Pasteurella skyensis]